MECDYCGLVTGAVACWEVSAGHPGDGMTRYVCAPHLLAARAQVGMVGEVRVIPTNVDVVVLPSLVEPIGEAA